MASLVSTAAKAAHSTAASLLSRAPGIKPGDKLPLTTTVKAAGAPRDAITLNSTGKTIIVSRACLTYARISEVIVNFVDA